jgi:hypothetical protein
MVVAFVALMVALGGTSWAVAALPKGSVGTKQLKRNSVAKANIKANAVDGAKVANDSLTGQDIKESSLAQVPSAASAGQAGNSGHANAAGAIDRVIFRSAPGSVPPAPNDTQSALAAATASCDPGTHAASGGARLDDAENTSLVDSYPDGGGRSWSVHVDNGDIASGHGFTVFVVCVPSLGVG